MSLAIIQSMKEYTSMIVKAAVIAIAVALIYMQDLAIVFSNALVFSSANITNYILVIPFLIAYVVYRKRRMLIVHAQEYRAKAFRLDDTIGLTLVFTALMLYIYGSLTLYAMEYHIYSIPVLVAGLTALLFNLKVLRHSVFAIIILAYLQPPPAELLSEIAGDLSWISATLAEAMLKAYGLSVALQVDYGAPALVVSKGDAQTPFFVGEPSSGLFSTIGLSLFALIAAYIARGALWKRAIMYVIGFPIFFLLNALRISIILLLWYHYGEQVSEAFHAMSGSIMAVPGTLAILIIGERLLKVRISIAGSRSDAGSKGCEQCSLSRSLNEHVCLVCSRLLASVKGIDGRAVARFFLIAVVVASMFAVNASQVQAQSSLASRVAAFDMLSIDGRERDTIGIFLPEIDGYRLEYSYRDQR
ncbi:MAG: exosortase/archaeosortase family protein, partial [Candidatus Nitrosocaldus sp.]